MVGIFSLHPCISPPVKSAAATIPAPASKTIRFLFPVSFFCLLRLVSQPSFFLFSIIFSFLLINRFLFWTGWVPAPACTFFVHPVFSSFKSPDRSDIRLSLKRSGIVRNAALTNASTVSGDWSPGSITVTLRSCYLPVRYLQRHDYPISNPGFHTQLFGNQYPTFCIPSAYISSSPLLPSLFSNFRKILAKCFCLLFCHTDFHFFPNPARGKQSVHILPSGLSSSPPACIRRTSGCIPLPGCHTSLSAYFLSVQNKRRPCRNLYPYAGIPSQPKASCCLPPVRDSISSAPGKVFQICHPPPPRNSGAKRVI